MSISYNKGKGPHGLTGPAPYSPTFCLCLFLGLPNFVPHFVRHFSPHPVRCSMFRTFPDYED